MTCLTEWVLQDLGLNTFKLCHSRKLEFLLSVQGRSPQHFLACKPHFIVRGKKSSCQMALTLVLNTSQMVLCVVASFSNYMTSLVLLGHKLRKTDVETTPEITLKRGANSLETFNKLCHYEIYFRTSQWLLVGKDFMIDVVSKYEVRYTSSLQCITAQCKFPDEPQFRHIIKL